MILLDTNAILWLQAGHRRSQPLNSWAGRLYISPASLLEIQFLAETQRRRSPRDFQVAEFADDPRWLLDDPSATEWFQAALELSWTHDPFDRLLAAHSLHRRWRLATGDGELLERLGARHT